MHSSRSFRNSSSINISNITAHSDDIVFAVNNTLSKFCYEVQFQNYLQFHNLNKQIRSYEKIFPKMKMDKTTLCEFNVGLWDKSLVSTINSLSKTKYPHYVIMQEFINYLLNVHSYTDFGLLEELFHKLLILNPARPETLNYYQTILSDSYVTLNGKFVEEQGLFFCLLDALIICLNKPECSVSNQDFIVFKQKQLPDISENCYNSNLIYNPPLLHKKNVIYFEDLCWSEKMKRCLTALNFVYNILETDFAFWLESKELKNFSSNEQNRPLLTILLWPDKRNMGLINNNIHKLLKIFVLGSQLENSNFSHLVVVKKLMNLLAEVIRSCDEVEELKYPHLGTKSNDLARELSTKLYAVIGDCESKTEFSKVNDLIQSLKPPWFRLLLCSHLISYISGCQCPPELTGAHDILENIACGAYKKKDEKKMPTSGSRVDPRKIQKLQKLKSINTKRRGRTLLQWACDVNSVDEVRALLTFSELDVNAVDRDGWTALHLACQKGHIDCVRILLFPETTENVRKKANTRARGPDNNTPLMCAVKEGHTEICRLLLEHTGSILLEDVNDSNQNVLDLSVNEEMTRMLKHYEKNIGRRNDYLFEDVQFDEKYKEIVIKLCVELINSYFSTHRTCDIYQALKTYQAGSFPNNAGGDLKTNLKWDYNRFHRDIKSNISKLKVLCPKLSNIPEFQASKDILTTILSFYRNS